MSEVKLIKLLLELESYEMGNDGMFDGWFDGTVWERTHGKSERTHQQIVSALGENEAQKQIESILNALVEYDEEQTGMFDYILEENGRKSIYKHT